MNYDDLDVLVEQFEDACMHEGAAAEYERNYGDHRPIKERLLAAIQSLQKDAMLWDFFRRTMLNSEARRYSFMRYFDLEPKIAEDLRDPDRAIDEAMQHEAG